MTAAVETIAMLTPVVTTNFVFSARRASKGIDAMGSNPAYGVMNMDIAGGQVLKGSRAAISFNTDVKKSVWESVKSITKGSKLANGLLKVLGFTADYINPMICATSAIKVIGSDDKLDTAARESLALMTMFAGEGAFKKIMGMPGVKGTPIYKNIPYLREIFSKFVNYCNKTMLFNKIPLRTLPGILKGVGFVLTSIFSYKGGSKLAEYFLGKEKCEQTDNTTPQLQMAMA